MRYLQTPPALIVRIDTNAISEPMDGMVLLTWMGSGNKTIRANYNLAAWPLWLAVGYDQRSVSS